MLLVTEAPLLLEYNDLIVAKVRANNAFGWGEYSLANTEGILTEQKPSSPSLAPILISQAETALTVEITAIEGIDTGGSEILSYNIQFKRDEDSTYVSIVGESSNNLQLTVSQ